MDYLIEIGTEELPAGTTGKIAENLKNLFQNKLTEFSLTELTIKVFSTPRRIALFVTNLPAKTNSYEELVKGPAPSAPENAITGFAKKNGVKVEELKEQNGRLCFIKKIASIPINKVLQSCLEYSLNTLSGDKWMTWADGTHNFSRPVRWLLSLLDSEIFELELFGLKADRKTRVNRLLEAENKGFKYIEISSAAKYAETLREFKVEVDREKRRSIIEEQITKLEQENNFSVYLSQHEDLLEEITDLLEWPVALIGTFEESFLELPVFLTTTVLTHHQRYFPCFNKKDELINKFVFISNSLPEAEKNVIPGNERVLKARLKDAEFFVQEDLKVPLINRKENLVKMTFQKELGEKHSNMLHKVERLKIAAANVLNVNSEQKQNLLQVAKLAKCDLGGSIVFEFPELQGLAGGFIAKNQGFSKEVSQAIAEQYLPQSSGEACPKSLLGSLISIIDKADNITSLFSIGKIPTGSADPFALRRQTQGIIEILLSVDKAENSSDLAKLKELTFPQIFLESYKALKGNNEGLTEFFKDKIAPFLQQRLVFVLSQHYPKLLVEAFIPENSSLDFNPCNITNLIKETLSSLAKSAKAEKLLASYGSMRRIQRILKSYTTTQTADPNLLKEESEKELCALNESFTNGTKQFNLLDIQKPIDRFFEDVLVEDPNEQIANNRKALLYSLLNQANQLFYSPDWDKLVQFTESQIQVTSPV